MEKRNRQMFLRRVAGASCEALAKRYGVTHARCSVVTRRTAERLGLGAAAWDRSERTRRVVRLALVTGAA